MKKIKIAQIGTSRYSHGSEVFSTLVKNPDLFEIVGYALPEGESEKFPEKVNVFEGYRKMTVEEILNDPEIEAVAVETEEIYLTKYAQMVANAGKHIHMEKPGGTSLCDFERLITTVKENKTVFHTGYMYRYNPAIREILERIRSGEIGEIVCVEAQMNCRHDENVVKWLSAFPGGMMFYLGCHMIDLVVQIQGFPKRIFHFNKSTGRVSGTDSSDFSMAVLEYDRGASIAKTTDVECGGMLRRQLVVTGTKGRFMVCPLEVSVGYPMQYTEYNECKSEDSGTRGAWKRTEDHDRYEDMMRDFAEMINGKENPYSYDYELRLYELIMKACGEEI